MKDGRSMCFCFKWKAPSVIGVIVYLSNWDDGTAV